MHNPKLKEASMNKRRQICCAAGLCASMAMLLAVGNRDQRSDIHKLSPARHAAAAATSGANTQAQKLNALCELNMNSTDWPSCRGRLYLAVSLKAQQSRGYTRISRVHAAVMLNDCALLRPEREWQNLPCHPVQQNFQARGQFEGIIRFEKSSPG